MQEITYRSSKFYEEVADRAEKHVHVILIATKPDIIKQVPLYNELKRRGHCTVLGHTGQHFSENLSGGMLKEFGIEPDFNLNVRGEMDEIMSQIIGRLGYVIGELKKRGKTVIPYVHGDTTTAVAASNAGYCHRFASVHVEAGIRTLTPSYRSSNFQIPISKEFPSSNFQCSKFDVAGWHAFLQDRGNWERGSLEPYPEQFCTRCSEASSGIHLAPVELDKGFMLSEGFPEDRIFVVGNSVVDMLEETKKHVSKSTVFERYPILAEGNFVRFCIHRRENCSSERRFMAIYGAMKTLIQEGRKVLLINMHQTKAALERFNLVAELAGLAKRHPNFVLTEVWSQYYDVIAAMQKAAVCATDSGSMQEEMNMMGVACVTLRFGSDRSESAMAGGNLIAPPINASLIKKMIEYAWDNPKMRNVERIYGKNVSKKSVDVVEKVLQRGEVFRAEEERLQM